MRQYQTIPKGVVFDNGLQFKSALLSAFCSNLGIGLIHASVGHPQTNGKLERAFRDDRREYYDQCDAWIFEELTTHLPAYVRYRIGMESAAMRPWAGNPRPPGCRSKPGMRCRLCWTVWSAMPVIRSARPSLK